MHRYSVVKPESLQASLPRSSFSTQLLGIFVAVLLTIWVPIVGAGEASSEQGQATVSIGAWGHGSDDSLDMVGEYEPDEGGPTLAAAVATGTRLFPWRLVDRC